jgi:hypoxanthine phosphoribosyltransferase
MKLIKKFDRIIEVPVKGVHASAGDNEKIRPEMKNRIARPLITRRLIKCRVRELAREIAAFYRDQPRIEMLFILEGASTFAYDLAREVYNMGGPEIRSHSIKARTYGADLKKEGEISRPVKIVFAPSGLEGKKVLVVEDIIDQGFTLYAIKDWLLHEARAGDVKMCALLDKRLEHPSPAVKRLRSLLKMDYVGFTIPDRWVAGYGIDAGDDFRFLPFIVIVKEQYYLKGANP